MSKIPRWFRKMLKLLDRAAMTEQELNTGVIRSTPRDDDFRISIASSHDSMWGDCVAIGFRQASDGPGLWHVGLYSPARCRLIALHLLHRAKVIEQRESALTIDKPRAGEFIATEEFVVSVSETVVDHLATVDYIQRIDEGSGP